MRSDRTSRQFVSVVAALCMAGSALVAGQSKSSAVPPKPSAVPRTPDGKPDLQGVWDFRTITPMERPKELANKATLTEEEARQWEIENKRNQDNREKGNARVVNGQQSTQDVERAYNDFWWDFGTNAVKTRRTSLVVDPPDGRMPPLTDAAQKRATERRALGERLAEGPEDRNIGERCILGFNAGPPMLPSAYNNNVQIVQTKDYVLIHNEMVHNARVRAARLEDDAERADLERLLARALGRRHARRRDEGVPRPDVFPNSSEKLQLVERFTRTDGDTLIYRFTVTDPSTWTKPWTAEVPMTRSSEMMFEYACHEANYGMENLLKGAVPREAGRRATTTGARQP